MKASPDISCVVPAYNGERFIAEALDSLIAQTLTPLEIIVMDDGSTDRTAEIVREYGPPVVYVHQANAGAATARNRGVEKSRGAFVAFLDADDIAIPERLELQMERFRARPELQVSLARVENFWEDELRAEMVLLGDHAITRPRSGTVTQAGLVRREILESIRFDPALVICHDSDWQLRAEEVQTAIEVIPEILVRRRMHGSSLIHSGREVFQRDQLLMIKKALDRRRSAPGS
ncbi:MAG TPA: glycosyltransferase family A protein [Gemmatimonadota bacterium]|nr:glycosyltransferase family A protein [Gemmatimonadota bacterium]